MSLEGLTKSDRARVRHILLAITKANDRKGVVFALNDMIRRLYKEFAFGGDYQFAERLLIQLRNDEDGRRDAATGGAAEG